MNSRKKNVIKTSRAPEAVGPYSQAIRSGDVLYVSGQIGLEPDTGDMISDSVEEQTHRIIQNLEAVLDEAGGSLEDITKVNVYLTSMDDYPEMNTVYENMIPEPYPARACVEVCSLPKNALVEIDLIATL